MLMSDVCVRVCVCVCACVHTHVACAAACSHSAPVDGKCHCQGPSPFPSHRSPLGGAYSTD
jgi:hypothetical protein